MKIYGLFVLLIFALGLACAPAPTPEEPIDIEGEKSKLLEVDRKWAEAYAAADNTTDAFLEQLENDAQLLPPEMPLATGKEAIRGVMEQLESLPGMDISWTPSTADVSNGADMGFTIGSYLMKVDGPDGNPVEIEGKYMTVWKKQANGSWKVTADMFNPNAPMAVAE